MPLFDWIRSDLHSLNLDWIISKIKTVEESEQGAVDAAADANASKTAAAASATAANNSKTAASGSATAAAGSAAQAQALVDQLDTTIAQDVSDWLDEHITPTTPAVDDTLTVSGAAADAKKTGDEISELKTAIDNSFSFNGINNKNLVGMSSIVYYPVNIEDGTVLTMSTEDGTALTDSVILELLDENNNILNTYTFFSNTSERTFTVNLQGSVAKWLKWRTAPEKNIQVEIGSEKSAYVPYVYPVDKTIMNVLKTSMQNIPVLKNWFVAGSRINNTTNDSKTDDIAAAYTMRGVFNTNETLIITSTDNSLTFNSHEYVTHKNTGYSEVLNVFGGDNTISVIKKDGTELVAEDIEKIIIYATGEFNQTVNHKIESSGRLVDILTDFSDVIVSSGAIISSGTKAGMIEATTNKYKFSKRGIYADSDLYILNGRLDTSVIKVFIDGVLTNTLQQGNFCKVEAGTVFALTLESDKAAFTPTNVFIAVKGVMPITSRAQLCSALSYGNTQDVGCSFAIDDKIFNISDSGWYSVIQGETVIKDAVALDHSAGHANSCNYYNGYAYVSDWRDNPGDIIVYAVDAENNTLTYSKTITIPIDETAGSTEYFVFDNEKQIYSLGWHEGNAGTDPNYLEIILWLKTTTGYVKAKTVNAVRPTILQGMIVQGNYIYYIDNDATYKTIGVNRINIATGETEYNDIPYEGGIMSTETEGIIPISDGVFYLSANNGRGFFVTFAPKERD